jgi:hypothetical protein
MLVRAGEQLRQSLLRVRSEPQRHPSCSSAIRGVAEVIPVKADIRQDRAQPMTHSGAQTKLACPEPALSGGLVKEGRIVAPGTRARAPDTWPTEIGAPAPS